MTATVTGAAALLADSGRDATGFTDAHAWRDAAVLAALGQAVREQRRRPGTRAGGRLRRTADLAAEQVRRPGRPGRAGRRAAAPSGAAEGRSPPHRAWPRCWPGMPCPAGRPMPCPVPWSTRPAEPGRCWSPRSTGWSRSGAAPSRRLGAAARGGRRPGGGRAVPGPAGGLGAPARPGHRPRRGTGRAGPAGRVGDALLGPSALVAQGCPALGEPGRVWSGTRRSRTSWPTRHAIADPVTGWRGGFAAVVANPPWERLKVFRREGGDPALGRRCAPTGWTPPGSSARAGRHPLTGVRRGQRLPAVRRDLLAAARPGRPRRPPRTRPGSPPTAPRPLWSAPCSRPGRSPGCTCWPRIVRCSTASPPGSAPRCSRCAAAPRDLARPRCAAARPAPAPRSASASPTRPPPIRTAAGRSPRTCPRLVNPNTATLPLCGSARDAALLAAAHRRWPVLHRRTREGESASNPWQVRLVTPLHMTRDARAVPHRARARPASAVGGQARRAARPPRRRAGRAPVLGARRRWSRTAGLRWPSVAGWPATGT